jgi:hypothetical protein
MVSLLKKLRILQKIFQLIHPDDLILVVQSIAATKSNSIPLK